MKAVKIFLAIWGVFLLGLLICFFAFTFSKIAREKEMTQAQIENLGKPIIYEQYYHSPKNE